MKKLAFITLLLLFGFNNLIAQQKQNRHENFKAYKVAYITQQLDLTPKEAEKFWPIYNAYGKEIYKIKVLYSRDIKKQIMKNGGVDALSEKEVNQYLINLIQSEEKFIVSKKKFYNDLKNVLPPKKILKLYNAENEFNRKLLSEFRKKKHKQQEPINN